MKKDKRRAMYSAKNSRRNGFPGWVTCGCGKHGYRKRKEAKRAMYIIHPQDKERVGMNVYECYEYAWPVWHFGHFPDAVAQGHITRKEAFGS